MVDTFRSLGSGLNSPISEAMAVTPSDAADLGVMSRAVYLSGGGDLRVTLAPDSDPVDFAGILPGWHPLRVTKVWATGTTATGIVVGW